MAAREINPFTALTRINADSIPDSQDTMIDEQSSASGHDYASYRSAIVAIKISRNEKNLFIKPSLIYLIYMFKKLNLKNQEIRQRQSLKRTKSVLIAFTMSVPGF